MARGRAGLNTFTANYAVSLVNIKGAGLDFSGCMGSAGSRCWRVEDAGAPAGIERR